MEKNSKSNHKDDFTVKLDAYSKEGLIPHKYRAIMEQFYQSYKSVVIQGGRDQLKYLGIFSDFIDLVKDHLQNPFVFQPYHVKIRAPYDYYAFGVDFLRPLVNLAESSVLGRKNLEQIAKQLAQGDNVILLANHQIEADPQAISLLLEPFASQIAEDMIFVAGERVTTDPLAVPFSKGRNLLCIYSKRYIDHPPEEQQKKQMHNRRTMELMSELLSQGSKCIYVAPSGGRDRPDAFGKVEVAHFDPQSIEMFYLMTKRSKKTTHFYPLALSTYKILPPPQGIQKELGETRITQGGGIHLAFGDVLDMDKFPGHDIEDKALRRKARADYIWKLVCQDYARFSI